MHVGGAGHSHGPLTQAAATASRGGESGGGNPSLVRKALDLESNLVNKMLNGPVQDGPPGTNLDISV